MTELKSPSDVTDYPSVRGRQVFAFGLHCYWYYDSFHILVCLNLLCCLLVAVRCALFTFAFPQVFSAFFCSSYSLLGVLVCFVRISLFFLVYSSYSFFFFFFFFLMIRPPPRSPLFPSTTLFRSSLLMILKSFSRSIFIFFVKN